MQQQMLNAFRRESRWRLGVTLLCLLVCTIQGFIAQAHVHGRFTAALAGHAAQFEQRAEIDASSQDSAPAIPGHPSRDNDSNCPLCQIVLHGAGMPLPAYAISLPLLAGKTVVKTRQAYFSPTTAVSHSWQSRGPPLG